MPINFLPRQYTRVTETTVVAPVTVPEGTVLTDLSNGWVISPERVEITLTREEGTPQGDRVRAYVAVEGPRRLKSGASGKQARVVGWEKERNEGLRGSALRPRWLTAALAENLPENWDPALLELPVQEEEGVAR